MLGGLFVPLFFQQMFASFFPTDLADLEHVATGEEVVVDFLQTPATYNPLEIFGPPSSGFPEKVRTESYGILTSADALIVEDSATGMMLLGRQPNDLRPLGSVTKLMSAMVFLDQAPDLSSYVRVPGEDYVGGGRIYLRFDEPILLSDVLSAALVGSDNTATHSLMRFSGLSEEAFIEAMNQKAEELQMDAATFVDPTGISAGNQATPKDVVKLLRAAEGYREIQSRMTRATTTVSQNAGSLTVENTNGLLTSYLNNGDYKITGGKTGYLPEAGYVLATAIEKSGNEIYVVVMGSDSKEDRERDVKGLATWAFQTYKWPSL